MKDLLVTVTESFENTQRISPCSESCCPNPACFHYPKYFRPQLHMAVPKSHWNCGVLCGHSVGAGGRGLGPRAAREPLTPHRAHPSFQFCCCGTHNDSPVCQPLDCLSDGQGLTLPAVRTREKAGTWRSLAWSSCGRKRGRARGA